MKNRETKSHDDGFTLVEMVVSFVLLLMLVSLSVVGILAYQDFADFKRQNSYAQTLFSAAQTKLTGYSPGTDGGVGKSSFGDGRSESDHNTCRQ